MSQKRIDQVRSDRGFKIFDLIIYGTIAVFVAALFIAVFVTRNSQPLSGFRVYLQNELIYEYDFEKAESKIYVSDRISENAAEEGKLLVTVHTGGGFNKIEINLVGKEVRVTDSDCGKRDCVYTPAITDGGGIIFCSPHRLKIEPYGFDYDGGNIII